MMPCQQTGIARQPRRRQSVGLQQIAPGLLRSRIAHRGHDQRRVPQCAHKQLVPGARPAAIDPHRMDRHRQFCPRDFAQRTGKLHREIQVAVGQQIAPANDDHIDPRQPVADMAAQAYLHQHGQCHAHRMAPGPARQSLQQRDHAPAPARPVAAIMRAAGQIDRDDLDTRQGKGKLSLQAFGQQPIAQIGAEFHIEQRNLHAGTVRGPADGGGAEAGAQAIAAPSRAGGKSLQRKRECERSMA